MHTVSYTQLGPYASGRGGATEGLGSAAPYTRMAIRLIRPIDWTGHDRSVSGITLVPMEQHLLKVLVVEDSAIMGKLLARLLAGEPYIKHVGTVTTAEAAVAAIETFRPDVTLLDLVLGAGNGFQVLQALKDMSGPRPNVVVLTNLAGERYRQRAIELGAEHFLDKSTDITVMFRILRELAARRRTSAPPHDSSPP